MHGPPHMLYTCLVDTARDPLLDFLLSRGIEARVYFPPIHRQPVFAGRVYSLPVTDAIAARMLSIPMHSLLTPGDLTRIADTLEEGVGQPGGR